MIRKPKEKAQAKILRKRGYSLKEISKKLHISKSSASLWLQGVQISPKARKRLTKIGISGTLRGLGKIQERWKIIRHKIEKDAEDSAKLALKSIVVNKHSIKVMCALIFWCEGGKRNPSQLRFINSDPSLVQTFLHLLRRGFNINEAKLSALIHLHEYHNEVIQKQFWSKITGIPISKFSKSYTKPHTGIRKRDNYAGCISINYTDGGRTLSMLKSIYKNFPHYIFNKSIGV